MGQYIFTGLAIISLGLFSCGNTESENSEGKTKNENPDSTIVEHEDTVITSQPKKLLSPRKIARGNTAVGEIEVDYGAPSVRDRQVWGALVPYDTIWRAGANETTAITFEKSVSIGNAVLEAGTYSYFIIPKQEGNWTIVLNTKWHKDKHDMWGTYGYDEANDVVRVDVEPEWSEDLTEVLEYSVKEDGIVLMNWEKLTLPLKINEANQ